MSLGDMINGASLPMGDSASLFKNPAADAMGSFSSAQAGMTTLSTAIPTIPGASASLTTLDTSMTGVNTGLTGKVSALTTDMPLVASASKIGQTVDSVDAITSGTSLPTAEPESKTCPGNFFDDAFAPIKEAANFIQSKVDDLTSAFNNTGAMSSLYSALNSIPGVAVSNGKELLEFLGNIPSSVASAVNSALTGLSTNTSFMTAIEGAFDDAKSVGDAMASEFNDLIAASDAALSDAKKLITNFNFLNFLNNDNKCVSGVMDTVTNTDNVDQKSLTVKSMVSKKEIEIPGKQGMKIASASESTIDNLAGTSEPIQADAMLSPSAAQPTIVPYTDSQINGFYTALTNARTDWKDKLDIAVTRANELVDWKKSTNYSGIRVAAGATIENNLTPTTTDTALAAQWNALYAEFITRKDAFLATYKKPSDDAEIYYLNLASEVKARATYGKYPYTYSIAMGVSVPEDEQFTNLDTTK